MWKIKKKKKTKTQHLWDIPFIEVCLEFSLRPMSCLKSFRGSGFWHIMPPATGGSSVSKFGFTFEVLNMSIFHSKWLRCVREAIQVFGAHFSRDQAEATPTERLRYGNFSTWLFKVWVTEKWRWDACFWEKKQKKQKKQLDLIMTAIQKHWVGWGWSWPSTLYTGAGGGGEEEEGDVSDIRPCLRLQRTDTTVTTVLPAFTLYDWRKKLSHTEHRSQIDTFTVLVLSALEIHDISCSINTGKEKKTD